MGLCDALMQGAKRTGGTSSRARHPLRAPSRAPVPQLPRQSSRAFTVYSMPPERGQESGSQPSTSGRTTQEDARPASPASPPEASSSDPLGELDMSRGVYRDASTRLETLLKGVGNGEEEMLSSMLSEETPTNKVILSVAAGTLVLFGAFLLCVLVRSDPLGGMRFTPHSLAAGVIGLIGGLPLVVFRVALWSEYMRARVSGLRELQDKESAYFEPLLQGLAWWQCAAVIAMEVLPGTVILLPGAQGGLSRSFALYCQALVDTLEPGAKVPVAIPEFLALITTAAMAAVAQLLNNKASSEEVSIVRDAMSNADRYYRVQQVSGRGGAAEGLGQAPDPQEAAGAFRSVAQAWLRRGEDASKIGAMLAALEVIYLGVMWRLTEDMASALVAGFFTFGVDFVFIRMRMEERAKKRAQFTAAPADGPGGKGGN